MLGNELGEDSAAFGTLCDDVVGPFEGGVHAVAAPNIDHAEPGDEGQPVVAAVRVALGQQVLEARAHHNATAERSSGRERSGSARRRFGGAGVNGELAKLFTFGVGAVHE